MGSQRSTRIRSGSLDQDLEVPGAYPKTWDLLREWQLAHGIPEVLSRHHPEPKLSNPEDRWRRKGVKRLQNGTKVSTALSR